MNSASSDHRNKTFAYQNSGTSAIGQIFDTRNPRYPRYAPWDSTISVQNVLGCLNDIILCYYEFFMEMICTCSYAQLSGFDINQLCAYSINFNVITISLLLKIFVKLLCHVLYVSIDHSL